MCCDVFTGSLRSGGVRKSQRVFQECVSKAFPNVWSLRPVGFLFLFFCYLQHLPLSMELPRMLPSSFEASCYHGYCNPWVKCMMVVSTTFQSSWLQQRPKDELCNRCCVLDERVTHGCRGAARSDICLFLFEKIWKKFLKTFEFIFLADFIFKNHIYATFCL